MLRDPFSAEDEASLYVPRPASEAALAGIEDVLLHGSGLAVLVGPVGIGKSLLLKVLESKLSSSHCCVRVDYEGLSIDEFCQWVLRELDARETLETERMLTHKPTLAKFREWMQRERSITQTDDPESGLVQLAIEFQGRGFPVALLIDTADGLKPDSARRLLELTQRANGALRIVLALTDGLQESLSILHALSDQVGTVRYEQPMSLDETIQYIKERLARSGASEELRACLDESRVRRLFKYSQGNPRRLHGEIGLIHLELSRVRAGVAPMGGYSPTQASAPAPSTEDRPWLRGSTPPAAAPAATERTAASAPASPRASSAELRDSEVAGSEEPDAAAEDAEIEAALARMDPLPSGSTRAEEAARPEAPQPGSTTATAETTPAAAPTEAPTVAPPPASAASQAAPQEAEAAVVKEDALDRAKKRRRRAKERITRLFERAANDGRTEPSRADEPQSAAPELSGTEMPDDASQNGVAVARVEPEVQTAAPASGKRAARSAKAAAEPVASAGGSHSSPAATETPEEPATALPDATAEAVEASERPETSDTVEIPEAELVAEPAASMAEAGSETSAASPAEPTAAASLSPEAEEPTLQGEPDPETLAETSADTPVGSDDAQAAGAASAPAMLSTEDAGAVATTPHAEAPHAEAGDAETQESEASGAPSPELVSPVAEQEPALFAEAKRDWEALASSSTRLSQVSLEPQATPAASSGASASSAQATPSAEAESRSSSEASTSTPEPRIALRASAARSSRTAAPSTGESPRRSNRAGIVAAVLGAFGLGAAALMLSSGSDQPLPDVASPPVQVDAAELPDEFVSTEESELGPLEPVVLAEDAPEEDEVAPQSPPVLTNVNAKPWATIEIDGRLVGETPLGELPLSPGPHEFKATMAGGRVIERTEVISVENARIVFE